MSIYASLLLTGYGYKNLSEFTQVSEVFREGTEDPYLKTAETSATHQC